MADILDLYLGLKTDEELISSQEYKLLKDNKIDTALLDGEDPDPNAGEVQLGKIDAAGNVTGNTTSDVLTNPISYFYFASADTATTSGVKGGGQNCSAGPVTLEGI